MLGINTVPVSYRRPVTILNVCKFPPVKELDPPPDANRPKASRSLSPAFIADNPLLVLVLRGFCIMLDISPPTKPFKF